MKSFRPFGRRTLTALGLAVAAVIIGALFGSFHTGTAAIAVKPTNQTPPTISGTPQVGQTLTAQNGTWTGTAPISFTYQWSRCDDKGKNCKDITGENNNTYGVLQADVGSTLVVVVVGTNADGKDGQGSNPTAVVQGPPPSTGCPSGNGAIQIADLTSPAHLAINPGTVTPNPIPRDASSIQLTFAITACGNRPVQGALVYATAVPYNQFTIPAEVKTGNDGWATMTFNRLKGYPASNAQQQLTMFIRARKDGENILAGISSRRLIAFNLQK